MTDAILEFLQNYWNAAIEIVFLAVAIYYGYLYFRGTRGAKVLTGLAILFITLTLVSQILNLTVISWLLRSLTAFLAIALVVIFQPELRRALAELGSSQFFSSTTQKKETIDILTEAVFELSNKQIGALIAIERDTAIRSFAAACIFPVSQREDLNRTLGLRHRAGLGITEESDAIAVVVSEETGNISICHRGKIERGFKPGQFEKRLSELLLRENDPTAHQGENSLAEPDTTP